MTVLWEKLGWQGLYRVMLSCSAYWCTTVSFMLAVGINSLWQHRSSQQKFFAKIASFRKFPKGVRSIQYTVRYVSLMVVSCCHLSSYVMLLKIWWIVLKKQNSKTPFLLASTFFCLAIVTDEKKHRKTKKWPFPTQQCSGGSCQVPHWISVMQQRHDHCWLPRRAN